MTEERKTVVISGKTVGIIFAVIAIGVFLVVILTKGASSETNQRGAEEGGAQVVQVSSTGIEYVFLPSEVRRGRVKFVVDNSVRGCMRAITIPALGVREVLGGSKNSFVVDIQNPGVYDVYCSMRMGRGKFTVA